jgi:hypothetical protein
MAGLTPSGFTIEKLDDIRNGIINEIAGYFGISPDALRDDSFDGHLIGILADRLSLLWQMALLTYSAFDPDKALDQSLDAVAAITGTVRDGPVASSVVLTLTGTPGTFVDAGSRAKVLDTGSEFQTSIDGTITLVPPWVASTPYGLGTRRTNSSRVYQVSIAGTSSTTGGPTSDANSVSDGTVTWRFLGGGTGAVDVPSSSVELDKILAISGSIRDISTPVGGWSSVINLLDADPGTAKETNESFRVRRERELSGAGSTPIDSLRGRIGRLVGVSAVQVFQNVGDDPDAFGLPGHSVEVLVQGGDNQEIFDTIGTNIAPGIRSFGTITGSHVDSQGNSYVIQFSRPQSVPIWIIANVVKNRLTYAGDQAVIDAIVGFGDNQPAGRDVDPDAILSSIFTVDGVLRIVRVAGIPQILVGTSPNPTNDQPLVMSLRQLALYDTSRVTVISIDGTP